REDLPRILRALDISVLASIEKEGLPVILVESALMGVPSVMTDVAGIREVIRHGETGLLAPPGDASALAAALLDALRDTSAARSRAASAREFVRREFDVNNTAAQMDEVYLAVSSARGKAAAR
ncbi:MAG TPA: glycosyltransferase, partial [bacterium]|nr:glycosyltransferase [bacterium]